MNLREAGIAAGLVLGSVVAVGGVGELVLRSIEPADDDRMAWRQLMHRPSPIPGLAYELVPNRRKEAVGSVVQTNSVGMRDDEVMADDTPGLLRIAAVGDSFTLGYCVAGYEAYPNVLERNLRAATELAGRPVEVLNFGVGGYTTVDEALVLEHRVLPQSPDLVIVGYFLNDPELEAAQPLPRRFAPPPWWRSSQILSRVVELRRRIAIQWWGGGNYFRYLHSPQHWGWAATQRAFRRMAALAEEHSVPVLLIIFPESPTNAWSLYAYRDLHQRVAEAAVEAGLDVLDLLAAFETVPGGELRAFPYDHHPNARGHRLTADALMKKLRADYPTLFTAAP